MDEKTKELIALGSSVTANCHPCLKFHIQKAKEMGIDQIAINEAIKIGQRVRKGAAGEMDSLIIDQGYSDKSHNN